MVPPLRDLYHGQTRHHLGVAAEQAPLPGWGRPTLPLYHGHALPREGVTRGIKSPRHPQAAHLYYEQQATRLPVVPQRTVSFGGQIPVPPALVVSNQQQEVVGAALGGHPLMHQHTHRAAPTAAVLKHRGHPSQPLHSRGARVTSGTEMYYREVAPHQLWGDVAGVPVHGRHYEGSRGSQVAALSPLPPVCRAGEGARQLALPLQTSAVDRLV